MYQGLSFASICSLRYIDSSCQSILPSLYDEKTIRQCRAAAGPDCGRAFCLIHYCHYSRNGNHRRHGVYVCERKDGSIPRKPRLRRFASMLPRSKIIDNQPSPGQGVTRVYEVLLKMNRMKSSIGFYTGCLFVLVWFGTCINGYSQNMLGATYEDIKRNYSTNPNLIEWTESKTNDGTPYVRYIDTDMGTSGVVCCGYLKDGRVFEFRYIGANGSWVNAWGRYADDNFVPQRDNIWMDYAREEVWMLEVGERITTITCAKREGHAN